MSSINQSWCDASLDQHYTDFLNALAEIRDETMRNRCYKYWTSLYEYFDRSIANERALILEAKQTRELLNRSDSETVSHRVRNVLERGYQVVSDLYMKYNIKTTNTMELEQNMSNLRDILQRHSSSSFHQNIHLTQMIVHLKQEIKNLEITRDAYRTELNAERTKYYSIQMRAMKIQKHFHTTEQQLNQLEREHVEHLELIHRYTLESKQISEELEHKIPNQFDPQYLMIDKELMNERKQASDLKQTNNELLDTMNSYRDLVEINETKRIEFEINRKNLLEIIAMQQTQIDKEKEMKQMFVENKTQFKRIKQAMMIQQQREWKMKNHRIDLEKQRNEYVQQATMHDVDRLIQSKRTIEKVIRDEVYSRLKLAVNQHNLKEQINDLEKIAQYYCQLVKEQRQQIIDYERLYDQWIRRMNNGRKRFFELFKRVHTIELITTNTKTFITQFDNIKWMLRPKILTFYREVYTSMQQRTQLGETINTRDESKASLSMKLHQMKTIYSSNQTILSQLQRSLSFLNQNHSQLLNQISTIDKQHADLIHYFDYWHEKCFVEQQRTFNLVDEYERIKHIIESNHLEFQRCIRQRQRMVALLLDKQHLIVLITERSHLMEQSIDKRRSCLQNLIHEIQRTRVTLLRERQTIKPFEREHRINVQHIVVRLRTQLFEFKKRTTNIEHRLHRYHVNCPKKSMENGTCLI